MTKTNEILYSLGYTKTFMGYWTKNAVYVYSEIEALSREGFDTEGNLKFRQ